MISFKFLVSSKEGFLLNPSLPLFRSWSIEIEEAKLRLALALTNLNSQLMNWIKDLFTKPYLFKIYSLLFFFSFFLQRISGNLNNIADRLPYPTHLLTPHYLGNVLRYYCPSFLPEYTNREIHIILDYKFRVLDLKFHQCLFWPCWLFARCPSTQEIPLPEPGLNGHWHCVYADCPYFFDSSPLLPFFTNLNI